MSILETLNWRYATKRMTGAKVPQAKVDTILEATRLSASAFGMQPYKVIVIENEELRKKLQPVAYNQPQIAECSHLLVFAAFENITEQHILNHFNLLSATTGAPIEKFNDYIAMVKGSLLGLTEEVQFNWNARQAYIALGTALVAAATEKVDASPMEGFSPAGFDEMLGLKELGLKSVVLLALGYRDAANDYTVNNPKVRKSTADFIVTKN